MVEPTRMYSVPRWSTALMLAGVLIWQGIAMLLLWLAFFTFQGIEATGRARSLSAFIVIVNIALWAALLIAGEVFLAYETEATHLRIFIAHLATMLALVALSEY